MKKLLLLLLISNFAFSQNAIDVRLVDENVGRPIYVWDENYIHSTNTSNDDGLNAILTAYGFLSYEDNNFHPYPPFMSKTKQLRGNISQGLLDALNAYSSVIAFARFTDNYEYTDATMIKLLNVNTGIPIGTSNNIVVTNDAGLNAIFENFHVFFYAKAYPSAPVGNPLLNYYNAVCDCDKNLLNTALLNYPAVVQAVESVQGGVMLSNSQFEKPKAVISPNPFSSNFNIETEQTIANYSIIDITGKTIVSTSSKAALDNQSSQLSTGMYILNLDFDNGQKANYKLVKK
ncbi:T9SS type A sorting domain-containing protein [Flavobacterium wongokense]|uniref:T9SS type A sorting domain-containing protein n=1 Tax=Flavobacterium wongokense TaxID=2910674 RepID=UPI001F1D8E5B|nr:T9SS type A sorting domain-containing protein [Flavobacterium sp. WG47]MCF6132872.1 T9SS type A sorting domain-containing protein [Flavobacterium sp. WG47]